MGRSQRHKVLVQGTDSAGKGLSEKQPAIVYIRQNAASQTLTVPVGAPGGPLKGSTIAGYPPVLFPAPGSDAGLMALRAPREGGEFTDPGQFNMSGNPIYVSLPEAPAGETEPIEPPVEPPVEPPQLPGGGGEIDNTLPGGGETPEADPPTLSSINPSEAEIGGPQATVIFTGSGFTNESTIVWNGGDEPTTYISPTRLTTKVTPATATTPGSYPVLVRNADGQESEEQQFTFTEAAAPEGEIDNTLPEPEQPTEPEPETPPDEIDNTLPETGEEEVEATPHGRSFPSGPFAIARIIPAQGGITVLIANDPNIDLRSGDTVLLEATGNTGINGEYTPKQVGTMDGMPGFFIPDIFLEAEIAGRGRVTITGASS